MCDEKLNSGHYHEVMDRASLMASTWEREVEQLAATQAHPKLKDAAEAVGAALADFYGLAGQVYFEIEEAEEEQPCPSELRTREQPEKPTKESGS